jgi:hypothetical protein
VRCFERRAPHFPGTGAPPKDTCNQDRVLRRKVLHCNTHESGRGRCRTSANGRSVAGQAHGVADRHLRRGHGADITSPWQQMLCCISPRSSLRCGSWAYRQGVGIACACLLIGFLILAMPRLKVRPVCRRWGLQRPGGSSGRTRMRRHDTQVRWQQMLRVRVQQKLAELEEELKKRC